MACVVRVLFSFVCRVIWKHSHLEEFHLEFRQHSSYNPVAHSSRLSWRQTSTQVEQYRWFTVGLRWQWLKWFEVRQAMSVLQVETGVAVGRFAYDALS